METRELLLAATLLPGLSVSALSDGRAAGAVHAERARLAALGADWVCALDATWPRGLRPDLVLRFRGAWPQGPRVAVVGTRHPDGEGRALARRIAAVAADAGASVVSGGALGIDAAAHEGALAAGGTTVAVLGSGLCHPAPAAHTRLFEQLTRQGALVSPFPCDLRAAPWTFPRRNPVIAALADVVVVVQAGLRSGTSYTVAAARALGRPVFVVPGPLDAPAFAGCLALIDDGARVLRRVDDFLLALPAQPGAAVEKSGLDNDRTARTVATARVLPQHREPDCGLALWRAAGEVPRPLADLAALADVPPHEAATLATLLEISGHLIALPGGRFMRAPPTKPPKES